MIIRPGHNQPSVVNLVELTKQSSKRRITIKVEDDTGTATDIEETTYNNGTHSGELSVEVVNSSDVEVFSANYYPKSIPDDRRITKGATGTYYLTLTEDETYTPGTYLANWHARVNTTGEDIYRVQVIDVVSSRILALLPKFRLMLDKSVKFVNTDQYCLLGYTDSMLIMYMQLGLSKISAAQPYPTFMTLDQFPVEYFGETLVKASLYEALTSQYLFSIDTDIPNYSDAGHSFVIDHRTPLGNYINQLNTQLEKEIQRMKMHLISSGTVRTEYKFGNYFWLLLTSSPYGSIFRGGMPNTLS